MTSFKFVYEDEVRRVLIREDGGKLVYSKLINTLLNLFPSLAGKGFQLFWEDDEGDLIACSSDAELDEAVHVMDSLKSKTLKFFVKLPKSNSTKPASRSSNVVHTGITCDECGLSPIVGVRYKCTVRPDFDLCEACEAKNVQPHAMIKIVDPSQAPSVLVYGLQDGPQQDRWQRGFHHRHHGHHGPPPPPHAGHPFPPPPFGHGPPPHHPHFRGGDNGHCRRKCDRWAKKWEKFADIAKESPLAPFVSAMDAVFNGGGDSEKPENAEPVKPSEPANEETVNIEEELIEKAILESLMINEEPEEEKVEKPKPVQHVETARPAVPTLPKPALRFVKDVTFADGTVVQPGALFKKAWRVRNDGSHPWPEGSVLVSVGGDVMSNQDYKEPLPVLKPDEETEIALQLNAPHLPGMYTSYFRAQTKDQQYFGQRLWASVVVADQESDWQVVTEDKQKAEAAKVPEPPVLSAPVEVPAVNPTVPVPALEPVVKGDVFPGAVVSEEKKEEVQEAPAVPASLKSAIILWRRELAVLNDMGFSDPVLLVPLLQQHLGSPLSLSSDKNAVPSVEGMQQVIATLLQMN